MLTLSTKYELINKTIDGDIIIADINRKGEVRVFELTKSKRNIKKFGSFEEICSAYTFSFEWFACSDYNPDYAFLNICYFSLTKTKYGISSENREKATRQCIG